MVEYIDQAIAALNKLYGLPAAALVFCSCIVVGYVIRFVKQIHNSGIPVIVTLWGSLAMGLIADTRSSDMPMRVWIVRNVVVGLIIGFAAWLAHKTVIKRIEDWIGLKFPSSGATTFFNKPEQSDQSKESGQP